ncbi:hypothetical protein RFI_24997 [Reticulomyxa filosa]|uniref:Uncharacterized protein n=1 Tax=Reticulomyxa filosa TaxID=46433 RepID=X6MEU2_RETFI|nr:hypothetical protein RFI_24997 [Reticulomyxa filosa]|eukprot:ETO12379.1 hypothetical protein RFI_24997 [Reticulomyxa filosa]
MGFDTYLIVLFFFMILHDCNLLCRNGRANFTWDHIIRSGDYPKIVTDPFLFFEEHTPDKCYGNCCWILIFWSLLCAASIIIFLLWTCAAKYVAKKSRFICIYSSWMIAFLRILVGSVAAISLSVGYVLQRQLHTNGWDKALYGFNQSIACSCSCNFYMKLNDFCRYTLNTKLKSLISEISGSNFTTLSSNSLQSSNQTSSLLEREPSISAFGYNTPIHRDQAQINVDYLQINDQEELNEVTRRRIFAICCLSFEVYILSLSLVAFSDKYNYRQSVVAIICLSIFAIVIITITFGGCVICKQNPNLVPMLYPLCIISVFLIAGAIANIYEHL